MKKRFLAIATMFVLGLGACTKDDSLGTAKLQVRLTDAPGDYEAVNVDIQRVEVNAGTDESSGWTSLKGIRPGVYDLLKLTNGLDTLLASDELPAGKIAQIRLVLGEKNTLQVKGQTVALKTPSAQQSGLKLNVNTTLTEGITYTILLDFDASRSIVKAGNSGNYNLKPVIRSVVEAQSGAIKGSVSPVIASPAVYAIAGTDTVGTYANATGGFLLKGLKPGTYRVVLQPKEGYQEKIIESVTVTLGSVSMLETIQLSAK